MTDKYPGEAETIGGGFKAINYVMSIARQVGARKLSASVRSKNACKACAFGTGGQRGGLHNEHSSRVEICNKNIQAQLSDHRAPIPPQIFQQNNLAELRQLTGKQLEELGRLSHPLYKAPGADRYELIDYDSALQLAGQKMRATHPGRSFFYGSGRSSNEAAFLLQLLARIYGCNHINSCSFYCHQASGIGLSATVGTGTATIRYADLHTADTIFVFGANPASNHPRFVKVLLECRQRGGKVIVVNPAREAGLVRFASPGNFRSMIAGGGEVASHYVQPHVGGDVAFIVGVAKCLLNNDGVESLFISNHTEGFEAYRDFVEQTRWQDIVRESGVDRETIFEISKIYQASQATVMAWGMGLTHHYNGSENIEAVVALALLRGMIGGPGKGLLPLRGHSNVQGVSTVGLTPAIKSQVITALEQELGIALPAEEGMDTLACVQAAAAGQIDFALLLGGNLYSANPDSHFSAQALDRIPFKVMLNSTLNETHLNGVEGENLILPVRVRDEEKQATTQESMFNFVRLSDGGFDRLTALRSEVELIAGLAEQVVSASTLKFSEFR
ncbi:MAG: molybdopterin-dependent oxidoreductase, partial [Pseudomonadota bacterium]|nr:molybdopterin-dependent oxidoreductase [Pseudomonadota bacterium]